MTGELRRATLVWHRNDGSTVEFALASRVVVGREVEATVRIDEPLVSRAHAEITRRGTTYLLRDLGSTNLTRVNGEIVSERELRDGDELRFGRARCVFLLAASDPSTSAARDDPEGSP
jgi:pSer/pThr/pTyr-binding forkhead associated (FHA) protein